MSKVLSAVFGIGIAVVVYVTMLLGIQAFYPVPEYENFCGDEPRYAEPVMLYEGCTDEMTLAECRKQIGERKGRDTKMEECHQEYEEADEKYARNFFIIASILGTLAIVVAYFLLNITSLYITNISAGVACSGIIMILWGFMRGWESTDEKLKFIVGLIIAVIIITLTVKLNKRTKQ